MCFLWLLLGCYKKPCHQLLADVNLPILLWQSGLFRCILKGQVLLFEMLICFVRRLFLSTLIFIEAFVVFPLEIALWSRDDINWNQRVTDATQCIIYNNSGYQKKKKKNPCIVIKSALLSLENNWWSFIFIRGC